jgi:hypothetical protein
MKIVRLIICGIITNAKQPTWGKEKKTISSLEKRTLDCRTFQQKKKEPVLGGIKIT